MAVDAPASMRKHKLVGESAGTAEKGHTETGRDVPCPKNKQRGEREARRRSMCDLLGCGERTACLRSAEM